jgi:hypothetical protein
MDLRAIGWSGMDCIDLGQDRDQWIVLVNTVINLWVPKDAGGFSIGLSSIMLVDARDRQRRSLSRIEQWIYSERSGKRHQPTTNLSLRPNGQKKQTEVARFHVACDPVFEVAVRPQKSGLLVLDS